MTPDSVPWWATATTTPPPGIDNDRWEAMPPGERMAAWITYRNTPNNAQEANT